MGRPKAPHGTKGAFRRHKDLHERVCDACQKWKDGESADTAVQTRRFGTTKTVDPTTIDPIQDTLENLGYVSDAMAAQEILDPLKIGPLSKRRSELLRELLDMGAISIPEKGKPAPDALVGALEGGLTLGNVTRISAASA